MAREAWCAAVHGVAKSKWTTTTRLFFVKFVSGNVSSLLKYLQCFPFLLKIKNLKSFSCLAQTTFPGLFSITFMHLQINELSLTNSTLNYLCDLHLYLWFNINKNKKHLYSTPKLKSNWENQLSTEYSKKDQNFRFITMKTKVQYVVYARKMDYWCSLLPLIQIPIRPLGKPIQGENFDLQNKTISRTSASHLI